MVTGMLEVDERNAADVARAVKAGELPGPAKSLAEAMARVYAQVAYIQKDKRMTQGGNYSYVSDAALIAALRPEMVRQGVTVAPVAVEVLHSEDYQTKSGGRMNRLVIRATFRFAHAGTGDSLLVQTLGEAADAGDKCANKAMTAAMKYALRQTFCVETGDDPDDAASADQERAAGPPPAAPQPTAAQVLAELGKLSRAADRPRWQKIVDHVAGRADLPESAKGPIRSEAEKALQRIKAAEAKPAA